MHVLPLLSFHYCTIQIEYKDKNQTCSASVAWTGPNIGPKICIANYTASYIAIAELATTYVYMYI